MNQQHHDRPTDDAGHAAGRIRPLLIRPDLVATNVNPSDYAKLRIPMSDEERMELLRLLAAAKRA